MRSCCSRRRDRIDLMAFTKKARLDGIQGIKCDVAGNISERGVWSAGSCIKITACQ